MLDAPLANKISDPANVIPSPGAVWPSMVKSSLDIVSVLLSQIVPPTSKTIIRPERDTASANDPAPDSFRLVT